MKKLGKNAVIISVDPGYDSTKVTVNGEIFDLPKKTVEQIGGEYTTLSGSLEGIYEVKLKNATYLCGPNVMSLVDSNKELHSRYDKAANIASDYDYIGTNEFVANVLASFTIALIKAEADKAITDADSADINAVVSLPHKAFNQETIRNKVASELIGEHDVKFKGVVDGIEIDRTFHIVLKKEDEKFLIISQVIACLLGYVTNEEGEEIDALKDAYPTVVIDGGYYTVADCEISKTKAISGAESQTQYGMFAIHTKVAEKINELCKTNLKAFDMDNLFENENGIVVITKDKSRSGKNEQVDCKKILSEVTKETFDKYIEYLEEKYNYFSKTKQILFGGGTGEKYFEMFNEIASDYPNVEAKLVTYDLEGGSVTPREAISAGAYKMVLNILASKE